MFLVLVRHQDHPIKGFQQERIDRHGPVLVSDTFCSVDDHWCIFCISLHICHGMIIGVHLVLAFNCSVNKKCNHSLWLSNICPSAKTFRPSASEITIIGINIINDLSPCNTPGYLPWTWMCFLPGNRGLLGGARRLPTSSSPCRLSWIGVPSCWWWSLELKQICEMQFGEIHFDIWQILPIWSYQRFCLLNQLELNLWSAMYQICFFLTERSREVAVGIIYSRSRKMFSNSTRLLGDYYASFPFMHQMIVSR